MRRILAIARKEFLHIIRDKRTLVAVLAMPLLQLFLFAYAVSFDVKDIPTAVLDQDHSAYSRQYVSTLQQSNYFKITQNLTAPNQIDGVFDRSEDSAVVVLPPGFGDAVAAGRTAPVQVLIDGAEPNSAQLGQAYATGLSRVFGFRVAVEQSETKGRATSAGGLSMVAATAPRVSAAKRFGVPPSGMTLYSPGLTPFFFKRSSSAVPEASRNCVMPSTLPLRSE